MQSSSSALIQPYHHDAGPTTTYNVQSTSTAADVVLINNQTPQGASVNGNPPLSANRHRADPAR
jgi:hypothetical protein